MVKWLIKFLKYQLHFFVNGVLLGTSFCLMFRIILSNFYLELFSYNLDWDKSKKKWDWRYWNHTMYSLDPLSSCQSVTLNIPEKYVYAIVTDIITQLIEVKSLYGFRNVFKVIKVSKSTRILMETIVEASTIKINKKYGLANGKETSKDHNL